MSRTKGALNKPKTPIDAKVSEAAAQIYDDLTPEQIARITPLEVMLYAMRLEVKAQTWRMASMIAEKAAPYVHAKLAARVVDDPKAERAVIRIEGGLPDD
jgi:hypothetical protein